MGSILESDSSQGSFLIMPQEALALRSACLLGVQSHRSFFFFSPFPM